MAIYEYRCTFFTCKELVPVLSTPLTVPVIETLESSVPLPVPYYGCTVDIYACRTYDIGKRDRICGNITIATAKDFSGKCALRYVYDCITIYISLVSASVDVSIHHRPNTLH